MKASEVLQRGKERLIENGWASAEGWPHGSNCALTSLQCAPGDVGLGDAITVLSDAIRADYPQYDNIISFNDARGRTFGEVMDAFDSAILLAKEREAAQ